MTLQLPGSYRLTGLVMQVECKVIASRPYNQAEKQLYYVCMTSTKAVLEVNSIPRYILQADSMSIKRLDIMS